MSLDKKYTVAITGIFIILIGILTWYHFQISENAVNILQKEKLNLAQQIMESKSRENINCILDKEISEHETSRKIENIRKKIYFSSSLTFVLLSIAASLLGVYLIRKPLAAITDAMKRIETGGLETKIASTRDDELGMLTKSLNQIRDDLYRSKKEIDRHHSDEIRHIEKMASIGEVAATVAHEIKNPLAGISGALQVLAEDYPEDSPRKEIANDILKEIERLDKSVKDLLFFARQPQLNLILTDINAIIERVGNALKISARGMNVELALAAENAPEVLVDPDQMEKALLNIAGNSLKDMPKGGTLAIAVENKAAEGEIEITISDMSGGMSEERLKGLFKPSFSAGGMGTGFNLAISRNIIEGHKGRISVESRIGAGNIFHIHMPVKR